MLYLVNYKNIKTYVPPIIDNLDISKRAKIYFNKLELYKIIENPIILDLKNIKTCNQWSFGLGADLTKFTKRDIKIFIEAVIKARTKYLEQYHAGVHMIFYFWYDDMSGNFYFNLICLSDEYSTKENTVKSIDDIINDFFADDACRGIIKFANLIDVDPDDTDEYELLYILNLWSIVIP